MGARGLARGVVVGHVGMLPVAWVLKLLNFTERYAIILHGVEAWCRHSWVMRIAARGASHIVATTHYTAREFCYYNNLEIKRCTVIPLATSMRALPVQRTPPAGELKLLMVTRLSVWDGYKGVDTVMRAVRLGLDSGLTVTLDLVGSGDDMERLAALAKSLDIRDAVHFRGLIPDADLPQVYRESHVFVMPSKKEGFGIAFVEAMTAGLPSIGANHGGTPEVIEHGETGFLIEYGDAEQLVSYLRAIIESPALYDTLSRGARYRGAEVLGFELMTRSWRKLVERLETPWNPKPDSGLNPDQARRSAAKEY